ncbi:MAG: T9SS type A sorting domain-containing protein [Bacteroidota bacterium]
MKTILLFVCCVFVAQSQNKIPFASQNNAIELSIANASTVAASNVAVEVSSAPRWLQFSNRTSHIATVEPSSAQTARFTFSVDKSAPVNKPVELSFTISNSNGERWTKTLSLQVSPPEKFELFQNYPNPFNPSTMISYQLPMNSFVTLKVYDAIGREVATLDEGVKEAGYHQKEWNAANISSGFYVYQLSYENEKGEQKFQRKKLMVMK